MVALGELGLECSGPGLCSKPCSFLSVCTLCAWITLTEMKLFHSQWLESTERREQLSAWQVERGKRKSFMTPRCTFY